MSNLQHLLGLYKADSRISHLHSQLADKNVKKLGITGLSGSSIAFAITGAWLQEPVQHIIICNSKEEAAYMYNNLESLLESGKVHYLPDSFKRPTLFEELNSTQVLERTEVVNAISSSTADNSIIVTYPEALFELVVSPKALESNRIQITKDEKVDLDFLIEILIEYGFERTDFVYEPGQFSIRGGIIDIYSHGNEWPYRVELFDEDVESIRIFDPLTQLSRKNISKIVIIPNVNKKFEREQKVSILEIINPSSLVWIADQQFILDQLQSFFELAEKLSDRITTLDAEERNIFISDRAFIRPALIIEQLNAFKQIHFGTKVADLPLQTFNTKPQPSFNKNFQLLIQNLEENQKKGIDNFLFTDNLRQIERFKAIFTDLGAKIDFHPVNKAINEGFVDLDLNIACYTDHQIFDRFHAYHLKKGFTKDMAINLKMLRELEPGDFVTHIDHGVGRYSGLEKITINGHVQESVRLIYKNNDILYVSINSLHKISKYVGKDGTEPVLHRLGSDSWKILKQKTKKKVKDIAGELIKLYAKRKASVGHEFPPDGYLQNELEASFLYEDTPDQYKATQDVKEDMQKPYPMDRLICGDVGFGKTEIALRAAFKAITDGKQVALLVPTTILALQHYKTFSERLSDFACDVDYLNRFRSAKDKKEIIAKLKEGKIDLIIGTHSLISKEVVFKDLGLLIIDEEQKFGVAAKEKLRNMKVNVDTLTLTATPIPRTLQFSLMGARDFSIIRTPPPNRQPIHTEHRVWNEDLIKDAIYYEVQRGGQVFFVHNRVKDLPQITEMIRRLCPDVSVAMAHGQLESDKLEQILVGFIEKKYDVLACTNIIETGLDIPNANTIIINNAHQFGLSDLHQLRGRVGRSNKKAYCYLISPSFSALTSDARKRIQTLEEFSDLGSGFTIAMRDLDIRGAGNMLGAEQSGFIADIGYEIFQKILDEAIMELKSGEFKDVFTHETTEPTSYIKDVQVDTDNEMMIPDAYISNIPERLSMYTELDRIETEEELEAYKERMRDRFGKIPGQVKELFEGLQLRWVARKLGFERVVLKSNKLRCYFINNPQSAFYESSQFQLFLKELGQLSLHFGISLKQSNNALIIVKDHVKSLAEARNLMQKILSHLEKIKPA